MNRRNWLDLSRKLVDRFDLDYTENSIESSIDSYAEDYYGTGVAQTPAYPNGLATSLSSMSLGGSVSPGVAYDPNGNRMIAANTLNFIIAASDPTHPRWDLLVLRYKKTGTSPVPKPSDPIQTVFLNLTDDFDLVYILGTPAVSPAYPAALANDVILDGVKVPANAVHGTDCALDDTVRMFAVPPASRLLRKYFAVVVPGTGNAQWVLPQSPSDPLSAVVFVDVVPQEDANYRIGSNLITFTPGSEPADGQSVFVIQLVNQTGSMAQAANTIPGGKLVIKRLGIGTGTDGTDGQASWPLPFFPIDPDSVFPIVDGLILDDSTQFSVTGQTLIFQTGSIPIGAQTVGVCELIGSTSIVGVVETGGGGGGGKYKPDGDDADPVSIDPSVGLPWIHDAENPRQLFFIKGLNGGGAQPVTAAQQIPPGQAIGEEITVVGLNDSDYPVFDTGNTIAFMNGAAALKRGKTITWIWGGTGWWESNRN